MALTEFNLIIQIKSLLLHFHQNNMLITQFSGPLKCQLDISITKNIELKAAQTL